MSSNTEYKETEPFAVLRETASLSSTNGSKESSDILCSNMIRQ